MRRKLSILTATLVVAGLTQIFMPAASAQTGYPPGPCTTIDTVITAGDHGIGSVFEVRLTPGCLWDPGSSVDVTVNGQSVGTRTPDAGGGVTVTITVLSATELSVNPVVTSQCGKNNVRATGPSSAAGGSAATVTANFDIDCDPTRAAGAPRRAGVAFTGDNILRWGGIALALMAGGWLLVTVSRRRRATPGA